MWAALLIGVAMLCSLLLAYAAHYFRWIVIPPPTRRVGCIDGLRGYLALAVFFHHCVIWIYVVRGEDWNAFHGNVHTNSGQASVAVFFMITAVLFYPKITRRLSDREWIAHFISRVFRLMPLLWFATAAVVAIVLYQNDFKLGSPPSAIAISLAQWLFFSQMPNLFGHAHTERVIAAVTWSLVYEWYFYIFLPGFSWMMSFIGRLIRPITVLLCVFAGLEWMIYRYFEGPRFYVVFVVGMIIAEAIKNQKISMALRSPWAAVVGITALLAEFVYCPTAFAALPPVLLGMFFAPVVAGNSYFKLLSLPASVVLGEISYGIYLLHGIVLYMAVNAMTNSPSYLIMPLLAPVVIALAILTHRSIELPSIALGRRLSRKVLGSERSK
jgi:peptidoglycan/LPS O-acetylase OafA/YrhL